MVHSRRRLKIEDSSCRLTADSHIACSTHAVPLPCRAAKGLERVIPTWFTQCGRVWFTFAMPCPCHAPTMPFFSRPHHSTAFSRRPCCAMALRRTAWSEHGMASVNQTRPHCVNQMGKTHSKPLAARHGRGTAWARHGNGMLCVNRPLVTYLSSHKLYWQPSVEVTFLLRVRFSKKKICFKHRSV